MNLLTTKIVTMSILGLVSLLVGFIPMVVAKKVNLTKGSRGGMVVSCLSCFGGGVILTTALTHMLPEVSSGISWISILTFLFQVNLFLQYNIDHGQIADTGMPLAEIWVLCGFFMIYFIEEVGLEVSIIIYSAYFRWHTLSCQDSIPQKTSKAQRMKRQRCWMVPAMVILMTFHMEWQKRGGLR